MVVYQFAAVCRVQQNVSVGKCWLQAFRIYVTCKCVYWRAVGNKRICIPRQLNVEQDSNTENTDVNSGQMTNWMHNYVI